ncbi:MAG: capsid cement protein [Persicimonas sp.]
MNAEFHTTGETAGGSFNRYAALKLDSGDVVETTAATEHVYGFAQHSADDGDRLDVIAHGPTKMIADGSISKGDVLMPAADGAVEADDSSTSGRHFCGRALEDADDGDIFWGFCDPDSVSQ